MRVVNLKPCWRASEMWKIIECATLPKFVRPCLPVLCVIRFFSSVRAMQSYAFHHTGQT